MYVEGPIIYAASPRQVRRAEVLLEKLAGMNLRGCPRGLQLAAKAMRQSHQSRHSRG